MRSFRDHNDALSAHASFTKFATTWVPKLERAWIEDRADRYGDQAAAPSLAAFTHMIEDTLNADTCWLSTEMMQLVESAATTFDASEEFIETDAFIPHGFMVLPEPFRSIDASGNEVCHRVYLWRVVAHGCVEIRDKALARDYAVKAGMVLPDHWDELPDDIMENPDHWVYSYDLNCPGVLAPALRISTIGHIDDIDFHHDPDGDYVTTSKEHGVEWDILHATAIPLPLISNVRETKGEADLSAAWLKFWRVAQKLMGERIVSSEPRQAARPYRREAQRMGFDFGAPRVIELRRRTERESDPERERLSNVEWSHRWIVGQFWRWQWYPSLGMHKQILIAAHEKGPKDKPLIVKERVWNWDR